MPQRKSVAIRITSISFTEAEFGAAYDKLAWKNPAFSEKEVQFQQEQSRFRSGEYPIAAASPCQSITDQRAA